MAGWHRRGQIDGWTLLWLDAQAKSLMDICGACERIRNTPLSSSYRALLRHAIAIYLAVAPFYLMEDTGIAGVPMFIVTEFPSADGAGPVPVGQFLTTARKRQSRLDRPTRGICPVDPLSGGRVGAFKRAVNRAMLVLSDILLAIGPVFSQKRTIPSNRAVLEIL